MSNRELAAIILLAIVLCVSMTQADVRDSMRQLAGSFLNWKIQFTLGFYVAYVVLWIWIASTFGLWNSDLLAETIPWFILSGFPLLFKSDDAGRNVRFFQKAALSTVELGVFFGFFVNLVTLSLTGELMLQFILAVLFLTKVVADHDIKHEVARRPINILIGVITAAMTIFTVTRLLQERSSLDIETIGLSLFMTIWLPIVSLGFVFGFSLFAGYEVAFIRMEYGGVKRKPNFHEKLAVVVGLNVRIRDVYAFKPYWGGRVKAAPTFRAAIGEAQAFQRHQKNREEDERKAQEKLQRFEGVTGVDAQGKQLDRREFKETQNALRWVATCQMGHYRNRQGSYRPDLMEILGNLTSHGLPTEHKIELAVRDDGQAWQAWRRTVSGWVFAIGASSKPSDQWLFDGPEPPTDFPSAETGWDHFAPGSQAINWS